MQILGTLTEVSFSDVVRMLAQARLSGTLVVRADPTRWVTVVDGAVDVVVREDGVARERIDAWRRAPDPVEQFRIRKDRLMELILVNCSGASFDFTSGEVEASGLPPFDLAELANRALGVAAAVDVAPAPPVRAPDRPRRERTAVPVAPRVPQAPPATVAASTGTAPASAAPVSARLPATPLARVAGSHEVPRVPPVARIGAVTTATATTATATTATATTATAQAATARAAAAEASAASATTRREALSGSVQVRRAGPQHLSQTEAGAVRQRALSRLISAVRNR